MKEERYTEEEWSGMRRQKGKVGVLILLAIWLLPWVVLFGLAAIVSIVFCGGGPVVTHPVFLLAVESIGFGVFVAQIAVTAKIYLAGRKKIEEDSDKNN